MSDQLLKAKEVADILRITEAHLRQRRKRLGIPAVRVGRELRFVPAEISAWLKEHAA